MMLINIGDLIDAVIGCLAIVAFVLAGCGIVGMIVIVLRDGGPWHVDDYEIEAPEAPAPVTDAEGFEVLETGVYDREEIHTGCTVQIWSNSATGETSVGWWEGDGKDE